MNIGLVLIIVVQILCIIGCIQIANRLVNGEFEGFKETVLNAVMIIVIMKVSNWLSNAILGGIVTYVLLGQ